MHPKIFKITCSLMGSLMFVNGLNKNVCQLNKIIGRARSV